jgi:hypothetical protein
MITRLSLLVLALALAAGCGKKVANTRCTGVTCTGATTCDVNDGLCKCGGEGGPICAATETCQAATKSCVNAATACDTVTCTGDTTCDPADGLCKCGGAGGPTCGASEVCQPATRSCTASQSCQGVSCGANEACDPADGACKCGTAACPSGQACAPDKTCKPSLCGGVHCVGATSCDPVDGQCKCNGALCGGGQACVCTVAADGGVCPTASLRCISSSLCANASCTGGTTCDPADGVCKCGGPGGPVCGSGQACDVLSGGCLGGDRCRGIHCGSGSSCDPEDGVCKCGGVGGSACVGDQQCLRISSGLACRIVCDTKLQNCPTGLGCYFDSLTNLGTGYCAAPGSKDDTGNPIAKCNGANDCKPGFNCEPFGGTAYPGYCHRYCEVKVGASGCAGSSSCEEITRLPDGGPGECCPSSQTAANACQ